MKIEPISKGDVIVGDPDTVRVIKTIKNTTGYPYNLCQDQIVRIIYFFGSRKLSTKALKSSNKSSNFTSNELSALKIFMEWVGLNEFDWKDTKELSKYYQMFIIKFKTILGFIKTHPAYVTKEIYSALKVAGYENVTRSIIFVVNDKRQLVPRLLSNSEQKVAPPLVKMDALQWELQAISLDKMMMIIQSITPDDIRRANLGMKSKAFRDIHAAYHMSKLGNKNPNLALVNINVNTSEPAEKLKTYSQYITRNREL